MVWAPHKETREAVKFWLGCLQVVTVIAGVATAVGTFVYHSQDQRVRANEQAQRDVAQLASTKRELERPYQEKKLNLYLDAARVLAHLASAPNVDKEQTEARFWELYWGELAFVESLTNEEDSGGPKPSVERLMVNFCHQYFEPGRCTGNAKSTAGSTKIDASVSQEAAIGMARGASKEIRGRWEHIGR